MDAEATQDLIQAALAPIHELVAKLLDRQSNLSTRLAINELLAVAIINTHPSPSQLEAAFFEVVLEAEIAQPHVPHGESTEWDTAVEEVVGWLRQSYAQAA